MGAVCCTLEYGKAVKENFYHGNLSGEFVHYHGYGRYDFSYNVAGHIQVSPDWLSAANTVGATGGKIISPQSIAIATSAGNQQGKEGEILKSAIPYALAYVLITGVIVCKFKRAF